MTSLTAIASKQVQLQELIACIDHFAVDDVRLHLFDHQGRISAEDVQSTILETRPTIRIEVSSFDIGNPVAITKILDRRADVVAFPLYRASALYRRLPDLKRRGVTLVHVTDGIGDLFTMWELQRAVLAKTRSALFKAALVIPQLYALRADVEFNLFHPEKTPYAKRCLPVGPFPFASTKRAALADLLQARQPRALVIDGFDLRAAHIAHELGLGSYVATRRDGGIDINGYVELPNEIICAEEVLALMRPELVVGCPSTSLAAARALYDDLPTFCLTTSEALRIRGPCFNIVFRHYAERFGIVFSEADDSQGQFIEIRQLVQRADHIAA